MIPVSDTMTRVQVGAVLDIHHIAPYVFSGDYVIVPEERWEDGQYTVHRVLLPMSRKAIFAWLYS